MMRYALIRASATCCRCVCDKIRYPHHQIERKLSNTATVMAVRKAVSRHVNEPVPETFGTKGLSIF